MNSLIVVLAGLNNAYDNTINDKKRVFFLRLANYGKYLLDCNSLIEPLLKELKLQSIEDLKGYEKVRLESFGVWRVMAIELLKKIKHAGIVDNPNDPFSNSISELKGRLNEEPSYALETHQYFYRPYVETLDAIKNRGVLTDKETIKNRTKIEIAFSQLNDEWTRFKAVREFSVWWAHFNIMRLTFGILQLPGKEMYFKKENDIDGIYQYEFNELSSGRTDDPLFLRESKFKEWLKTFHTYITSEIQGGLEIKNEHKQNHDDEKKKIFRRGSLILDLDNAFLKYKNGSELSISPETQPIQLLIMLMNRNGFVEYKEIAKKFDLSCYRGEDTPNKECTREVQDIKKQLRKVLLNAKVPANEIDNTIQVKINFGYRWLGL